MTSALAWRALSAQEARRHPKYGLRGWLGALVGFCALMSVMSVFMALSVFSSEPAPELVTGHAPLWAERILMAATMIAVIPFTLLAFFHSRLAPAALAFGAALDLATMGWIALRFPDPAAGVWSAALEWTVSAALWGLILRYVFTKTRPNVTFRRREPA